MTSSAFDQGRGVLNEGRFAIALEHFTVAADEDDDPAVRCAAMAHAAEINILLQRPHEALVWAERLREESPAPDQADLLAAQAEARLGNGAAALALLDGVDDPNTKYHSYATDFVALLRAEAMAAMGRYDDAVELASATVRREPDDPAAWRLLARLLTDEPSAEVDLAAVVADIPEGALHAAGGGLVEAPIEGAERVAAALWERWPDDTRLLATLATIGHRLPVASALEWSARMRAAGHGEHCPLLGVAASPDRHPRERVRAAAAAGRTFDDDRARGLMELATTAVSDEDLAEALDEVVALAPDYADSFVVAASQTARRALIVAAVLVMTGNDEPAVAVASHALELTTGQPQAWDTAVVAVFDDVEPLARAAQDAGAGDVAAALRGAASG